MTILAIDTSGTACSAALCAPDRVYAEVFTDLKKNHSVMLMPMVDEVFTKCDMSMKDVDYIAVTNGPGSFTGLRIGAATAKALAHAAGKKLIPVPTLTALAYNVYSSAKVIVPIMDARRNQVYTGFYRWEACRNNNYLLPQLCSEFMAEDITVVLKMLEGLQPVVFIGDACRIYSDIIKESGHDIAPYPMNAVRASSVGALGIKLLGLTEAVEYNALVPFYLRLSQAEREMNNKENAVITESKHSDKANEQ